MFNAFLSRTLLATFTLLLILPAGTHASDENTTTDQLQVAEILTKEEAPDGVVFELIGNEGSYLLDAIKKVETYKEQLQQKFPELEVAVVSHGSEQFNLTKDKQTQAKETHSRVQRLVDADVPVHICETHASWRDVAAEDFPDYISVSSTGPGEIRNYQALGYQLIIVE